MSSCPLTFETSEHIKGFDLFDFFVYFLKIWQLISFAGAGQTYQQR